MGKGSWWGMLGERGCEARTVSDPWCLKRNVGVVSAGGGGELPKTKPSSGGHWGPEWGWSVGGGWVPCCVRVNLRESLNSGVGELVRVLGVLFPLYLSDLVCGQKRKFWKYLVHQQSTRVGGLEEGRGQIPRSPSHTHTHTFTGMRDGEEVKSRGRYCNDRAAMPEMVGIQMTGTLWWSLVLGQLGQGKRNESREVWSLWIRQWGSGWLAEGPL